MPKFLPDKCARMMPPTRHEKAHRCGIQATERINGKPYCQLHAKRENARLKNKEAMKKLAAMVAKPVSTGMPYSYGELVDLKSQLTAMVRSDMFSTHHAGVLLHAADFIGMECVKLIKAGKDKK